MSNELQQRDTVDTRDATAQAVLGQVDELVAVLSRLPDEQKVAIVGLVALSQRAVVYGCSRVRPDMRIVSAFQEAVARLSPWAAARVKLDGIRFACMGESIAYVVSVAQCMDDGASQEECEKLAAPEAAAEIACVMKQLEQLKGVIPSLLPPVPKPGPQPLPIDGG